MVADRQHLVPCVLLWGLLLCGQQASGEVDVNVTVNNVNPEVPVVDFVQVVSQAYVVQQVNDSTAFTFTECPIGYYCESADGVPIPCPGGTYQPAIGAKNLSNCLPCPPGEYCPSASVTPLLCPVSTYRATAGADDPTDCLPCPGGYVCPDNQTSVPTPCPAGTFLPYTGGYNLTLECQACPAGRYCPDGTMTPVNCPAGTFNVLEGAGALSGCVPCTRGGYCINGSMAPHPCDAGTYMPDLGAEAAADCLACTTGHYCGVETSTPTGCPGGTYMPGVGASFVTECVTCTVSHFCPVGTTTPYECLAGSYHTGSGLASSGDCVLCEPGLYQNDTGTTGCRLCLVGAYQTGRGTPSAGACTSCPAGTYQTGLGMPALANCTLCAEGNYQDVPRSTNCTLCGAGTYQTGLGMPEEARCSECGSGTYQTGVGLTAVANCLLCPANTFQPLTRQVSQAVCQSCPPLTHSPNGSAIQVDCVCDLGYEGANGGPCTQCNSSVWCRSGTPNPCPAHSLVNGTGAWEITDCLCLPGYYGFALNPVPCALCQADYYCPGQAVNLTLACPYGEYSLPGANASSSCYCPGNASSGPGASSVWSCTCDPGFKPVSSGADPIVGWECTHCVAGEVCYNDTVTQCPVDSFSSTGVGNFMNCVCNPGFYQVESPTAALMCRQCEQGYYCPGGVNKSQCNALMTSNMQATNESACYCVDGYVGTGNQTCQGCVSPYYCTLGMQLTCPQYSASVGRSNVIQNCSCNTGYWGQNGGSCRACAPGTYKNFQGCVSCQNVVATDCAACPLGTASNDTARPSVCPSCVPGYYQDTVSLTSCKTCLAGKYLESSGGVSAGNCTDCPAGTYSTAVAVGNVSLCVPCPLGQYCGSTGLTVYANCTAGTYAGVTGLSACALCPAQTYMASMGATVCTACADGSFSDVGETFCKALTCAANSIGNVTVVLAPNASVRIIAGNRLDSPNTYAVSKNYHFFWRVYMDSSATGLGSLVQLVVGATTLWNAYQNPTPTTGLCYVEGQVASSTGSYLGTRSQPRTWDSWRLVVNENMGYLMLNGGYYDNAALTKSSRSTYASGAIVYAAQSGGSGTSYIKDVYLVTCKCKLGYYGDGDTCTACASGYLALSVGLSACTICPAGYYCPNATTQTSCAGASVGSYCGPGQTSILQCLAGYYCPDLVTQTACPAGTYSATTSAANSSVCLVCPAGSSCLAGSSAPQPCTSNSNSNQGGVNADSCTCNSGYRVASHSYFDFDNSTGLTVPSLGPFAGAFQGSDFSYTTATCRTGSNGCLFHSTDNTKTSANTANPLTNAMFIPGMTQAGTGGMTVSYWFLPDANSFTGWNWLPWIRGYGGFGFMQSAASPDTGLLTQCGNIDPFVGGWSGSRVWFAGAGWRHFAIVFNPLYGIRTYVNGVQAVQWPGPVCSTPYATNYPEVMGLHGTYDDLVVVNAALDATQVSYLYNGARPSVLPLCTVCPAGSYCPTPTSVLACPTGTYNPSTMQTDLSNCLACPVGFYCASTGMTAPTACPVGTYRDATGGTVLANCTACSAGTYQGLLNASSLSRCLPCPATTYGPTTGLSVCTACPAGQYADVTGLTVCAVCTAGSYCSAGVKTACPYANMTSQPGGYSLLDCYCTDTNYNSAHTPTYSWRMGFENGDFTNSWTGKELLGGVSVRGSVSVVTNSPSTCKTGGSCMRTTSAGTVCLSNTWGNWNSSCGSNGVVVNPQPIVSGPSNYRISFWVNLDAGATGPLVLFPMYYWSQSAGGIWVGGGTLRAAINNGVGFTMGLGPGWKYVEFTTVDFFTLYVDGVKQFQTSWQYQFWTGDGYTFINYFAAGGSMSPFVVGGAPGLYDDITYSAPDFPYSGTNMRLYTPSVSLGSVSCSSCLAGYHQVDATCVECAAGYSCPTPTSQVQCAANTYAPPRYGGGGGSSTCNTCQEGSTAPAGSTSGYACVCPAGAYWRPNWLGNSGTRGGRILITDAVYSGGDGFLMNYYGNPGNCTTCAVGSFSGVNATACIVCPAGAPTTVAQTVSNVTDCKCQYGYSGTGASLDGLGNIVTNCSICAVGSYSLANSPNCSACPAGTYGATAGISVCATCLVGSYCPTGASVGITCPAGSYCVAGSSAPTPCPSGKYYVSTGGSSLSQCQACPANYYCPTSSGAVQCPGYTFAWAGSSDLANCSSPANGLLGAGNVWTCQPGYLYVANASLLGGFQCNLCLPGYYCANGAQTACAAGTYQPLGGAVNVSQCLACALSTYASSTATTSCTACRSNSLTLQMGSTSSAQCVCVAGTTNQPSTVSGTPVYYTFDSSSTLTKPALGLSTLVGSVTEASLSYTSTGCKNGGGCVVNNKNGGNPCPWQIPSLPLGTGVTASFWYKIDPNNICSSQFGNLVAMYWGALYFWYPDCTTTGNSWCYDQSIGGTCPGTNTYIRGLATNTWQHMVSVQSATGPYALYINGVSKFAYNWSGTLNTNAWGLSGAGVSLFDVKGTYDDLFVLNAPVTAAQALQLYNGDYSAFFPSDVCALCSAGAYTNTSNSTGCLQCSAGTFTAAAGQAVCGACSTGSYQLSGGSTFCTVCPAGSYCPSATSVVQCPATTYSNASGRTVCSTCEPGTYQPGSNSTTCISCSPGSSCALGVSALCVAGTYSPSSGLSACLPCPLGDYCPAGASQPNLCPAGSEGTHLNSIVIGNCTACVPGSVTPSSGMSACVNCSSGQYQLNSSATTCYTCAMDSYCPSTTAVVKCPNGTGSVPASTSLSACVCPALSTWLRLTNCTCLDGYMRVSNASALAGFQCDPCPLGQFCAGGLNYSCSAGSVLVNGECACPAGRKRNDGQCVACGYGYHSSLGMQTNCTKCPSGSNTSGQTSPDVTACHCDLGLFGSPQGGLTCSPCRPGYFCPWNASAETACPSGTYQPLWQQIHSAACLVCPTGGYCPEPGANAHPTSCPNGTSSWQTGQVDEAVCEVCPAGTYCPAFSAEPTICPAGTFGAEPMGENASACAACPAGQYCEAGVTEPTPCPAGRHLEREGGEALRDCDLCPEGSYSLAEGVGGPCPDCPGDLFCQTPLTQQACPEHTTSAPGSYTKLNCSCDGGYACSYHKVIQAVVTVNSTVNSFLQDVGGVQTAFINTLALAAHVDPSQVVINSVASADQSMRRLRRLLGLPSPEDERELPEGVHVTASIAGVNELRDPALHQHGGLKILEHSWEELHLVSARAWR